MKTIKLTQGYETIVDDDDFNELSKYKWYYSKGYAVRNIPIGVKKQTILSMHVAIMGSKSGLQIDHINGKRLDNRKENLRHVTNTQNQQNSNSVRKGSSKYKGVHWRKGIKRWISRIVLNGKQFCIGCYESEIEAAEAYNKAAIEFFGEFARINEIKRAP